MLPQKDGWYVLCWHGNRTDASVLAIRAGGLQPQTGFAGFPGVAGELGRGLCFRRARCNWHVLVYYGKVIALRGETLT